MAQTPGLAGPGTAGVSSPNAARAAVLPWACCPQLLEAGASRYTPKAPLLLEVLVLG